jgi:glucose-specific phosphotransferase system IIA component
VNDNFINNRRIKMFGKLFGSNKKNEDEGKIYAPMAGEVIELGEVKDPVFSKRVLGDGVAIIPKDGRVYSPVDGRVTNIAETKHAYGIETEDGVELLIHVGMDTVSLDGEGFEVKAKENKMVKRGELLGEVDLNVLRNRGFDTVTPIIITNMGDVGEVDIRIGDVMGGQDLIMEYHK